MRQARFFIFLIMIAVGVAGGLYLGWVQRPLARGNADPTHLRSDYQLDYVLMVAEVYHAEQDAALAATRLTWLSEKSPARLVQEAIVSAGELGYARGDLELLAQLAQGLLRTPGQEGAAP